MTTETRDAGHGAATKTLRGCDPLQHWAEVHQALMEEERKLFELASQVAAQRGSAIELDSAQLRVALLRDLDDAAYRRIMSGSWDC